MSSGSFFLKKIPLKRGFPKTNFYLNLLSSRLSIPDDDDHGGHHHGHGHSGHGSDGHKLRKSPSVRDSGVGHADDQVDGVTLGLTIAIVLFSIVLVAIVLLYAFLRFYVNRGGLRNSSGRSNGDAQELTTHTPTFDMVRQPPYST